MILTPAIPGRQRIAGGASVPVIYPRAGYTGLGPTGLLAEDKEPLRQYARPFPNGNGPTTNAPGSALVPQQNS